MYSVMVIDPHKLKEARGSRTQEEIVEAAKNTFSVQQLSAWEHGKYRPRPQTVPSLLTALGVPFEEIAQQIAA